MAKKAKKESPAVSTIIDMRIENFGSLGKRIEFGAKSKVALCKEGFKIEFLKESVVAHFGIGKNNVGYLVMSAVAWEALNHNEKIDIITLNEFKKNFL